MSEENVAKGYTCACGVFNRYDAYVYAHWRIKLYATCDCGRKYAIFCGHASLAFTPKKLLTPKKPKEH